MRKSDIEKLAVTRLEEASSLLDAGHFSGAYYLAGYAIELAFKAVIARNFRSDEIPDRRFVEKVYSHDVTRLVALAELEADRLTKIKNDEIFAQNWEYVAGWSEIARYSLIEEDRTRSLIEAIRDPEHGVFAWIRARW
jgi:HEPN domain-containing protein